MSLHGGQGSWTADWVLEVAGARYGMDEISESVSISCSSSSNGFSVGHCFSSSISGTLIYKHQSPTKNAPVILYSDKECKHITFQWYISTCTYDDNEINFSARDLMAFADNPYDSQVVEKIGDKDVEQERTIGAHITTAIATMQMLSATTFSIDMPSYTETPVLTSGGWNIRQLLEYCAGLSAGNYYVTISNGQQHLTRTADNLYQIPDGQCSKPRFGISSPSISRVRVLKTEMEIPILEEGETLEQKGVFEITESSVAPDEITTYTLINPIVDYNNYSTVLSNLKNLIGKSFGTEFSCEAVELSNFIPPLTQVQFPGETKVCYLSSITYKLTVTGLLASMSGTCKGSSDYEYIGHTEKSLKSKISLDKPYGTLYMGSSSGLSLMVKKG